MQTQVHAELDGYVAQVPAPLLQADHLTGMLAELLEAEPAAIAPHVATWLADRAR